MSERQCERVNTHEAHTWHDYLMGGIFECAGANFDTPEDLSTLGRLYGAAPVDDGGRDYWAGMADLYDRIYDALPWDAPSWLRFAILTTRDECADLAR